MNNRNREAHAFSKFEYAGWERVAHKYGSAWSGLTRLFINSLLDATGIAPGMRLLDVACGPGYVAEVAAARGALCTGLDFSPAMINLARSRNPGIHFCTGDALALDFENNSFDAVVRNFGLLHLSEPEAAFSEANRVLQSKGRYGFTVWAGPDFSIGARIVGQAVQDHADASIALPEGPDYFGYGDEAQCGEILGRLGFDSHSLSFETVTVEWEVPTGSFLFEAERDAGVRTAALLAAQKREVLSAIQEQIEAELQPYAKTNGYSIPFAAHVIAASKV